MTRTILQYILRRHNALLQDAFAFEGVSDYHLIVFLRYFFAIVASIYFAAILVKYYVPEKR